VLELSSLDEAPSPLRRSVCPRADRIENKSLDKHSRINYHFRIFSYRRTKARPWLWDVIRGGS
jgi:hypothetical protein